MIVIAGAAWFVVNRDKKPKVEMVPVADVVGLTQSAAEAQLRRLGLGYDATPEQVHGPCVTGTGQAVSDPQVNSVCTQGTKANTEVAAGTTITYTIYAGPQQVSVPAVVGETLANARTDLNNVHLGVAVQQINDSSQPAGTVTKQDPTGGNQVNPGTLVTLTVTTGNGILPDVRHKSFQDARTQLQVLGWKVIAKNTAQVIPGYKVGEVMYMDPGQGAAVPTDQKITLTVATPAPVCTTTTPAPITSTVPTDVPVSPTPGVTPTPGVPTVSTTPSTVTTTIQPSPTVVCTTPAG